MLQCNVFSSQRRSFLRTITDDEYVFRMWEISVIYCTAKQFTANKWSTGIPRRKLLKSLTLAKPWLMRSKSNDKCGIRRTTFAVDMRATTGSYLLTHNIYLLITRTRKVMPTKCHKRMHSTGTVRGPVLRLSNKCEPDLSKSPLPYIFSGFYSRRSDSGTKVEAMKLYSYAITPPSTSKYGSLGAEADISV